MKIAVVTDSNSGIAPTEAKELGVSVVPMPLMVNCEEFFEDINLSHDEFYHKLEDNPEVVTSQPSPESVMRMWDELLKDNDEIVYIPMSSGLSGSCQTAHMLAQDYDDKVFVVNNQRISVTLRSSVIDALNLAKAGKSGAEIKQMLEDDKFNSSIYIMVGTLEYLKKGGRLTPAVAAIGNILKIKPILQIQGEKLDAFAMARTLSGGKQTMISAVKKDAENRFGGLRPENVDIFVAYSHNIDDANEFREEVMKEFPGFNVYMAPLSLSISCHIGPSSLALAITKKLV